MARSRLGYDEPSTIDGYLDLERVASGATYSHREIVIPGGTATGQLAQFASQPVAATALGLIARLGGSSGVNIGNVKPAAGTSWHIEGNTTIAPLTTGSKIQVEPAAGTSFHIEGNATVSPGVGSVWGIGNSSGAIASGNPLHVFLQGSTATVTVQGNATAILTTGSKVQVEPGANATFGVGLSTGTTGRVELASGGIGGTSAEPIWVVPTTTVPISGTVTVNALTTGSKVQVEPGAGSSWHIEGNTTVTLTTGTTGRVELSTGGMGGSTASPVFVNVAPNISQIYQGTTALVPQFSSINVTASGIADVVASAAGAIYVLSVQLSAQSSCTIQWMEGSASGLTGVQAVAAGGGFVLPHNPTAWFHTSSGLKLCLSVQGTSGGVGGSLVYVRPAS